MPNPDPQYVAAFKASSKRYGASEEQITELLNATLAMHEKLLEMEHLSVPVTPHEETSTSIPVAVETAETSHQDI